MLLREREVGGNKVSDRGRWAKWGVEVEQRSFAKWNVDVILQSTRPSILAISERTSTIECRHSHMKTYNHLLFQLYI